MLYWLLGLINAPLRKSFPESFPLVRLSLNLDPKSLNVKFKIPRRKGFIITDMTFVSPSISRIF
jgi:hypothetical protein